MKLTNTQHGEGSDLYQWTEVIDDFDDVKLALVQ